MARGLNRQPLKVHQEIKKKSQPPFSHLDQNGNAQMVGVLAKPDIARRAVASGFIQLSNQTLKLLKEKAMPKGDVFTVAKIAGIQAAKKTSELIPLCHPLPIHRIDLQFKLENRGVSIRSEVETVAKTGVEMEALTAVSIAALTIYDMCKAVDKTMKIGPIFLVEKVKAG